MENNMSILIFILAVIVGVNWLVKIIKNIYGIVSIHMSIKRFKREQNALK